MWRVLLIQLIAILCVGLAVGVWKGGPYVGVTSVWLRLLIIAAIVLPPLIYLIYIIVKKIMDRKAAKGLEEGMKAQGLAAQQSARPDRAEEIGILNESFTEAVEALRRSKMSLYDLPWYMIIGPPAAGKSTALLNSGLKFPYTSSGGKAIKGVGGTRNCDWWFSEEAILLDTAGRYTSEYEDQDEWMAFLRMIKRHRKKRPLNGLIVCISMENLLQANQEQVEQYASQIRERVDQVINELEMITPIYVLLSKCDLLSGFVETFGDLKKSARRQVLGFTVPLAHPKTTNIEQLFNREFAKLSEGVERRLISRLAEAQPHVRGGAYQFPLQFAAAQAPLAAFLNRLFTYSPYQESPRLRGVYLCSGTQEGQPFNQVVSQISQALGLGQAAALAQEQTTKKSYFLYDVFTQVMFPDRRLAGVTATGLARRLKLRVALSIALLVLAGGVLAAGTTAFIRNKMLVSRGQQLAKAARQGSARNPKEVQNSLASLQRLGLLVDKLQGYETDGRPLSYRFGFYSGDKLLPPLEKLYAKKFWQVAGDNISMELDAALTDITTQVWSNSKKESETNYNLLKTYVMVTEHRRVEVDFATPVLMEAWKLRLHSEMHAKTELLQPILERYLRLLKQGKHKWTERNPELLERVRNELRKHDVDYERLVGSLRETLPPFKLRQALKNQLGAMSIINATTDVLVLGVYTQEGWSKYVKKRLPKKATKEAKDFNWVMGYEKGTDPGAALKQQYFKDYGSAWRAFVKNVSLKRPRSPEDTKLTLKILTETKIYQEIFTKVADNTYFGPKGSSDLLDKIAHERGGRLKKNLKMAERLGADKALKDKANKLRKINSVEREFRPIKAMIEAPKGGGASQLDQYLNDLRKVREECSTFIEARDSPDSTKLLSALKQAYSTTDLLVRNLEQPALRAAVEPMFRDPLNFVAGNAKGQETALLQTNFGSGVCDTFNRKLKGKYPFARSKTDALPTDVAEVFAPGTGSIWVYFEKSLKDRLNLVGDNYVVRDGRSVPANIVAFINKAHMVTRGLFPPGAAIPSLNFRVRPSQVNKYGGDYSVSEITLEVDGQSKTYRMGREPKWDLKWPGEGEKGARVLIRGEGGLSAQVEVEGDWSLLRLMDKASRVRPRGNGFFVEWTLKRGHIGVPMIIVPDRTDNPIMLRTKVLRAGLSCR